jgi:hypothetical protein
MKSRSLLCFWFAFFVFIVSDSFGSHLRCGQITFRLVDCGSDTYDVILVLYTNTLSPITAGDAVLNFGDGSTSMVPALPSTIIDSLNAVGMATYEERHTFPHGGFTVSYYEGTRDAEILNISLSGRVPFVIESFLLVDGKCDQPMLFSIPPIDRACSGFIFTHNPGISAPADDSISYELVTPLQDVDAPAEYQPVTAPSFYAGNYLQSNEAKNGPPVVQVGVDGTLTWDAPGVTGEYAIDIKVSQWKREDDTWVISSWVIRDMQILVLPCNTARPYLNDPPDVCVHPGDVVKEVIRGFQPDSYPVTIQVFTVDDFKSSPPQFVNADKLQSTLSPNDTANIKVNWSVTCDQVRPQPYKLIFKISSINKDGVRISSFQTWQVKVIGEAPVVQSLKLNVARKTLSLQWQPYPCSNIVVDVYRRVDRRGETPLQCQPDIPRSWGYSLIGSSTSTNFTDLHLAPGATYRYRLIARFPGKQGVSIVSKDTCIGPLVIDAPVITSVSVNHTDKTNGAILIRWTPPYEINQALFPPPYKYIVQRTTNSLNYTTVTNTKVSDTTWVDSNLNVVDSLFGYRVIVYSVASIAGDNPLDTSALAFYPRLTAIPLSKGVSLNWDAVVPWSNESSKHPWHHIYRKELESSAFALMDSIRTDTLSLPGFYYTDYGLKANFPINQNTVYVYKVETEGTYGNPKIHEPLQNFSNEISTQPIDKTPPCTPQLSVQTISCEALINYSSCNTDLKNTVVWTYPLGCGNDVAYYKIFFSSALSSDTTFLASTTELEYIHSLANSMAGCYQVLAVDRSGHKSLLSSKSCVENCTNIFLPNVITVNGDGLNETFPDLVDTTGKREPYKCPRFVKAVSFQIYDRWGEEVYRTEGTHGVTEWNGLDKKGHELSSGVYFYTAKVFFYSLNPEKQSKDFNGIVNLIR